MGFQETVPVEVMSFRCWLNPLCLQTPLAQWAIDANTLDGIDPIPPEVEPIFYID
jgi:hypothetical protein